MKVFAAILLVAVLAFVGIKMTQTPSVPTVKAVQQENKTVPQENMTQFSNDLEKFMTAQMAKKSGVSTDVFDISAKCKPNQGVNHTRCWISVKTAFSKKAEAGTAENVRRVGDKFVWDHES